MMSLELKAEWHPILNLPLLFNESLPAKEKYWWLGACGHEWDASLTYRRSGSGCSYCSGKKILRGFNDFASHNPELLEQWHLTKNSFSPYEISAKSSKRAWWICSKGHEWEAKILHRANGSGCGVCAGNKILAGYNDLAFLQPEIASEWHPTKNGDLTPQMMGAGSKKKVWWLGKCGHEWETVIGDRVSKGIRCHYCSGRVITTGVNDLFTLYPHLKYEIHPTKNSKNIDISFERINSLKKIWWLGACGHEFETSIYSRTTDRTKGTGCQYCGGNRVLEGFNDLASQNPTLAAEFHPTKNGNLAPNKINAKSGKKFWWLGKCNHEWESQLSARDNGAGCSVCAGKKVLAGFNDLASKLPAAVPEWHPTKNGNLKPTEITVSANKKLWWMCSEGHEWESRPNSRANGAGCPTCAIGKQVSKVEKSLHDFVATLGVQFETSNRNILKGKEIDLWVPSVNVGIEFNGTYWHREKHRGKTLHHDKYLAAQKAGIQLIQIWEDDWIQKLDLVKRLLAQKLGVAKHKQMPAEQTDVIMITEKQAEEFLTEDHLQGYAAGTHYLGLVSKGDIETLQAVMALKEETGDEVKVLNIVRYSTKANVVGGFEKLLAFAANAYRPLAFTVIDDHCISDAELFENSGFIADKVVPPDYMYIVKNERKPRSEYPLERFRDDPKLLWEEGLTEMQLADLNGLDRIWDAGKTCYRLSL